MANTAATPVPGSLGPRISHSLGEPGGYLVLWPRVIPTKGADGQRALALRIQSHLSSVVSRQARGGTVDVRPEPERACPRSTGCLAAASNVLLIHHSRGCVAVGMFTPPGGDTTQLIPLAGQISLKSKTIPFRDPPESQVVVHDFAPCDQVMSELMKRESEIEAALRATRGVGR
ncbi:MAG: hypothetical protein CMH57_15295 [Myxococcales bacterium]|nr:hypothetical protein [Myxococcales bacterium]